MDKKKILYDLLAPEAPPMPQKLPKLLSLAVSKVPAHMKAAVANSVFPALGSLMHNVSFRFIDNADHETHFMCGLIGPMSIGKGSINPVLETIIHSLREHDEESNRKLNEWRRQYKSAGANKQKPERPLDAAILAPEPDMTNPALIQLLMDAEAEGKRFLYTNIPEVDLLDQCCASHKKVTRVIRLAYDTSRYGAQRVTPEGISGNPHLRWNFNFSCVERRAQKFFKECLDDGTLSRIGMSYVQRPKERTGKIPKQGIYTEEFQRQMDEYLVRLQAATGRINCPRANTLARELTAEMAKIADLADDDQFDDFSHRAVAIAWLKACVLYVADGYQWSNEIAAFMRWSLYYDLWSKLAIFAPQLQETRSTVDTRQTRRHGPANMLDMLPEQFTIKELEEVRLRKGKDLEGAAELLKVWKNRGYIEMLPREDGSLPDAKSAIYRKVKEE